MDNRRSFIQKLAIGGVGISSLASLDHFKPDWDGSNWDEIKAQFPIANAPLINLNSGSAGSMPFSVLETYLKETEKFNTNPLYLEKSSRMEEFEFALKRLARFMDCSAENLVLTKNTTESLNSIIWGYPLKSTDNIIIADADYAYVQTGFENRALKEGFEVKRLNYRPAEISDEEIVNTYIQAMDINTKLIVVSMITPREGQLLPAREIIQAAHERGIEVLIDGAHTLGHCEVSIKNLNCDYFAGCLHKWMNAPHGLGVLYVKEEHIEKIDPPMFPFDQARDKIMGKYTFSGTIGYQKIFTLNEVMNFNERINLTDKIDRLKYLSQYWQDRIKDIPGVSIVSDAKRNIALGGFRIKDTPSIIKSLREQFQINIKKTAYPEGSFYRISSNIFIDEVDMDKFIAAIEMKAQ